MRWLALWLALALPAGAQTLRLEFAQEGEPQVPRAVIIIPDALSSRDELATLLQSWGTKSWARDQYCSVYTFEYQRHGLFDLETSERLAKSLLNLARSDSFDASGGADEVNPYRRTRPSDHRQPTPTIRHCHELLLVGFGQGGLVARQLARMAPAARLKVTRVAYVGTPLDGLATIDLVQTLTIPERSAAMGLVRPLGPQELDRLSDAWWDLPRLFDYRRGWATYFTAAYQEVKSMALLGDYPRPLHPTDNVLYGRNHRVSLDGQGSDGMVPASLARGVKNGPAALVADQTLSGVHHRKLAERASEFLFKELIDREVTWDYLWRREGIEAFVRGRGFDPIGIYWDERDNQATQPQWREAYATKKSLYELMWGVAP
ncbi:MAG: hypothetical protein KC910_30225 [Candidatus Eremiobacteraeota bacterium]|nr:hypothetical protein [Candidatus Eremiobacteraeota bacterium]